MEYASRVTSPTLLLSTGDRFEGADGFKEKRAPHRFDDRKVTPPKELGGI
jgi:hypothetical protein